jgi:hypothetical protein
MTLSTEQELLQYLKANYHEQRAEIMAKEVLSVDSTDEEYQLLVGAYLKALDAETCFLGNNSTLLLDIYVVITENARYRISIGRTKNMYKYDIRNDGPYETCRIFLPEGDMMFTAAFCYSDDNKFFLVVSYDNNDDFVYELSEIFTKVKLQQ